MQENCSLVIHLCACDVYRLNYVSLLVGHLKNGVGDIFSQKLQPRRVSRDNSPSQMCI